MMSLSTDYDHAAPISVGTDDSSDSSPARTQGQAQAMPAVEEDSDSLSNAEADAMFGLVGLVSGCGNEAASVNIGLDHTADDPEAAAHDSSAADCGPPREVSAVVDDTGYLLLPSDIEQAAPDSNIELDSSCAESQVEDTNSHLQPEEHNRSEAEPPLAAAASQELKSQPGDSAQESHSHTDESAQESCSHLDESAQASHSQPDDSVQESSSHPSESAQDSHVHPDEAAHASCSPLTESAEESHSQADELCDETYSQAESASDANSQLPYILGDEAEWSKEPQAAFLELRQEYLALREAYNSAEDKAARCADLCP